MQLPLLREHLSLECLVLLPEPSDDAQFVLQESAWQRFLNIIAGVDGYEEMVESLRDVTLVETAYRRFILNIRLGSLQGTLHRSLVIEMGSKLCHFRPDEDLRMRNRLAERHSLQ